MGEISDFKEKNVEVLIENYDIDKFEPDPFNYVIKTLSFDKLKEILMRMPVKAEPFKVRVRVITKDYIFLKHRFSKKTLYIRPNQVGNFFTQWKYELQASLWSRSVPLKKIHKVDPYLSGEADLSFWHSFFGGLIVFQMSP